MIIDTISYIIVFRYLILLFW